MNEEQTVALAELTEALLDEPTLRQLAADLRAHTELLDVLVKGGARRRTDGKPVELEAALASLLQREVVGVQIRYRWQDDEWRDTLFYTPEGIKLVRTKLDFL